MSSILFYTAGYISVIVAGYDAAIGCSGRDGCFAHAAALSSTALKKGFYLKIIRYRGRFNQ